MTTSNTIGNPTPPPVSPPPQPPPASLGALTDSEQRIWNTLVGDTGTASATQAIINSRALNAGTAAINSGSASTVTVTPAGSSNNCNTVRRPEYRRGERHRYGCKDNGKVTASLADRVYSDR